MKTQLLFFCTAALVLSQSVWAQEPKLHKAEVRFSTLPSMQSYSLEGTGFTASNGASIGSGTGAGFTWMRQHSAWKFDYQSATHKVTSPSGLSPSEINSKVDRLILNYEFMKLEEGAERSFQDSTGKGLTYLLGIEHRSRKADTTTPNVFMPTKNETGVRLGVGHHQVLDESFLLSASLGIFVPLIMDEASAKTGYYRLSLSPDLAANFIYKVNHFIDFSVGIQTLYSYTSFTGTGTRGVTDAVESTTNIFVPVELRFKF